MGSEMCIRDSFIDFSDIGFRWVFNIADSAITVGVIGLIIASFVFKEEDVV